MLFLAYFLAETEKKKLSMVNGTENINNKTYMNLNSKIASEYEMEKETLN